MAELIVKEGTKAEKYENLLPQLQQFLRDDVELMTNLAHTAAALKQTFPAFSWVGFYLMQDNRLMVGPYQGKVACTTIDIGEGVCGTCVQEQELIIVPDVSQVENHIYCDPDTQSEMVVPIMRNGAVLGVLDIDSYQLDKFDTIDEHYLGKITQELSNYFSVLKST